MSSLVVGGEDHAKVVGNRFDGAQRLFDLGQPSGYGALVDTEKVLLAELAQQIAASLVAARSAVE